MEKEILERMKKMTKVEKALYEHLESEVAEIVDFSERAFVSVSFKEKAPGSIIDHKEAFIAAITDAISRRGDDTFYTLNVIDKDDQEITLPVTTVKRGKMVIDDYISYLREVFRRKEAELMKAEYV